MFKKRLKELEKIIAKADREYYLLKGEKKSTIDDDEYSLLLMEWKALTKLDRDFKTTLTPGFVVDDSNIVGITEPMLSILEYMDEEKFLNLRDRYRDHTFEKKYDGIEIRIIYNKKGILDRVHLRGDGKRGRDISHRRDLIRNIPKKITPDKKEFTHITGEVVCFLDDYEAYCDKFQIDDRTPKNIVGNLLGREEEINTDNEDEENDDVLDLYFIAFHASGNIRKKCKFYPRLTAWLKKEGFDVPTPLEAYPEYLPKSDFSIDGVVIKDNVLSHWNDKVHTGYYSYCGAYKYPKNIKVATVKGVVWGIGPDGTLKGTLRISPVTFNGQTFDTCLFLYPVYYVKNQLSIGSKVEIGYQPQTGLQLIGIVEKCLNEEIKLPTRCPYCQSTLFLFNKDTYKCVETDTCQGQLNWRLQRTFSSRGLNIQGIKASHVMDIIKENRLRSLSDIFQFTKDEIKGINFSQQTTKRIVGQLKSCSTEIALANWICAAGLFGLGEARSLIIENTLRDLEADITPYIILRLLTDTKKMYQLFGADAVKIVGYALTNQEELIKFFQHFDFHAYNNDKQRTTRPIITISGILEFRRSDLIDRLNKLGYCCDYTLTKDTKYFLTVNNQAVSKTALAKRYGIRNIDITGMSIEDIVKYLGLNE